jgi:hypothetical protein
MVRLYQSVQRLARQLAPADSLCVIWAYCQYLQTPDFQIPDYIEVAPQFFAAAQPRTMLSEWTLEQITREVIQYADEGRENMSLHQWATLAQIANTLRALEGEIYAQLVGGKKIHLEMMRISHRQFIWQQHRPKSAGIIRYYKLFNTPAISAVSQHALGLTIDHIFLIGMSYIGMFLQHPLAVEHIKVEIPGLTEQHVECFLQFTSLGLDELRKKLRVEHALNEDFAYRYSSLREFPLVKILHQGVAKIACPVPTLLYWRITSGLYYALRDQKDFSDPFGKSFQDYVGEVLRYRLTDEAIEVIEETEYQVGKDRKDTVDWIVRQGDEAALFVECKTKRLRWASKVSLADLTALEHDINKLAGAVVQVYRTIKDYQAGHYPHLQFIAGRLIYPVIVTLEDWYFFGHELPAKLDAAVRRDMLEAELAIDWLEEMPYSIMSVDECETAIGVINSVGVHPFISGKVLDRERRFWTYGSYYNDRYAEEVGSLPDLFQDEYEAMFAELKAQDQLQQ